ncbi:class I SAM-dependent methyltransferase [Botrimarina hoheduenensis]|uniref:Methyltransferase type 12 domain-containing protein n=1 Tax=Botrimarina hoheduenensis TaxID=2528000 RepID=A0A5C5W8L4_9BACT|nr:class I SAM-dependent methyltransferase [Botrimarina hoheduenensis]TWT46525.1 hypothetical protein Pla111_16210 [Botrimarina hoheduenensis]
MTAIAYRWNRTDAATAYDAAAPHIHPHYHVVQAAVLSALPRTVREVVDLGGGSGRLAEQILEEFPAARVTIVDPSEPFLALAEERLERFAGRFQTVPQSAQGEWRSDTPTPDAIVSTSALHHLDSSEKNAVFAACRAALEPGGVFINGDEYRPPSDAAYRADLEAWGAHMNAALALGAIPPSFGATIKSWHERNLEDFGGPRTSGDDCHETIEEQIARLYGAGFHSAEAIWKESLWGVVMAQR